MKEEEKVSRIDNLIDKINKYLTNQNLPGIQGSITDIRSLFEGALKSIWNNKDKEKREYYSVEIANALKPYFGGKNISDALTEITKKHF